MKNDDEEVENWSDERVADQKTAHDAFTNPNLSQEEQDEAAQEYLDKWNQS